MKLFTKMWLALLCFIVAGVNSVYADEEVALTADMFYTWDGDGADASSISSATVDFKLGETVGQGTCIAGTGSVLYLTYADLTGSTKLLFEGTPGLPLRVLMNRQGSDSGPLTELNPTLDADGKAEVDLTSYAFVHLNAIKVNWGDASGQVTSIKMVKPSDPLAAPKEVLKKAIAKAKLYDALAYTEASFAALTGKITDGETALAAEGANAESLETATNDINNAINALAFKPGFSSLKDVPFGAWSGWDAEATMTQVGTPAWTLFEATGQSYGDPSVNSFADVSAYEKLYITTASGSPRILLNRTADNGQWNENEAESNLIDNTKGGWSAKYFSQDEKVFIVDLKQLVADKGFAHLTSIKSNDNNVVTGIYLYKTPAAPEPIYIETDLTAQFPTDYKGWAGATDFVGWAAPEVTTNDGRKTAACERYETNCNLVGDVFTRTLTGLANGTYRIELYGAAANTPGRGCDSGVDEGDLTSVYLYAETPSGLVKQYIPAHVADNFNGSGIDTAVLENVEVTDGTIKVGMYKEKAMTNWHVVQIKGVTAQVNGIELHATTLANAQEALTAEENAIITGKEKTALETAIAANEKVAEQTAEAYQAAIKTLNDSLSAFTGVKAAYQSLADAKAVIATNDFKYADSEKAFAADSIAKGVAESAADATEKAASLTKAIRALAESSALAEGIEGAKNCTDSIKNANSQDGINGWTVVKGEGSGGNIDVKSNEPFTDAAEVAAHNYFDGGDWGANAWDVTLKQDITLTAGKYLLTATARASQDVDMKLYAGKDSVKAVCIGAEGGLFNRGWDDLSVTFELEKDSTIEIGVRGVTNVVHNWMSFTRFRLIQLEAKIDSLALAKTALNDAIIAAKAVDTTGKTEESAKALTDAIADAEAALAAEGATVATLNDAKTALEAAVAGLKDQPKDQIIPTEVAEPTYTYPASWDFTNWSDATVANLKADAAYSIFNGWSDVEKDPAKSGNPQEPTEATKDNCFWHQGKTDAYGQLYAAGVVIEETKGLQFTEAYAATRGLAIAVNYPSTSLGEYAGGQYLWLGGGGKNVPCFVLPQVPAGMQITMVVESHKPADARGVELYAGSIDAANKIGDSFKPTTQDTHTWDIETAGDIVVYNTSGCHIYSISVTENLTGIKSIATDGLNSTIFNMNGQRVMNAQKGLFIINGKKVVKK